MFVIKRKHVLFFFVISFLILLTSCQFKDPGKTHGINDLKNKETVKSQFNSRYQHDCMAIDFYLSRGFYSVSSVKPGISLGVKVELTGLTKNNKVETSQRCNGS